MLHIVSHLPRRLTTRSNPWMHRVASQTGPARPEHRLHGDQRREPDVEIVTRQRACSRCTQVAEEQSEVGTWHGCVPLRLLGRTVEELVHPPPQRRVGHRVDLSVGREPAAATANRGHEVGRRPGLRWDAPGYHLKLRLIVAGGGTSRCPAVRGRIGLALRERDTQHEARSDESIGDRVEAHLPGACFESSEHGATQTPMLRVRTLTQAESPAMLAQSQPHLLLHGEERSGAAKGGHPRVR